MSSLPRSTIYCIVLAALYTIQTSFARTPTTTIELRNYICKPNDCRLEFEGSRDGWIAINDNGCYQEYESDLEETVEFCPLQCSGAKDATIIEQVPASQNCIIGTYVNVIQQRNDWFLWRSEECQKEKSTYKIGCTFDIRPKKKEEKQPMTKSAKLQLQDELNVVAAPAAKRNGSGRVTKNADASEDDALVRQVDLLLKAMYPKYRD